MARIGPLAKESEKCQKILGIEKPTCTVNCMSNYIFATEEHVHVKELKKMLKPPPSKTFKMKGKIGDNDLKIKCQHMVELLEKFSEIHVEIARRKYDEENVSHRVHEHM